LFPTILLSLSCYGTTFERMCPKIFAGFVPPPAPPPRVPFCSSSLSGRAQGRRLRPRTLLPSEVCDRHHHHRPPREGLHARARETLATLRGFLPSNSPQARNPFSLARAAPFYVSLTGGPPPLAPEIHTPALPPLRRFAQPGTFCPIVLVMGPSSGSRRSRAESFHRPGPALLDHVRDNQPMSHLADLSKAIGFCAADRWREMREEL